MVGRPTRCNHNSMQLLEAGIYRGAAGSAASSSRGFPSIVLAYGGIQSFDWRRALRRPNLGGMRIQKGKKVPNVVLAVREEGRFTRLETDEIFLGKKVVVFSLPGAFTPTCSSTHLPRYEELAPIFKQAGVDDIVCVSVNDAFVMEAWGKAQGLRQIRLLPDGNGYFSEAVGMLVDKSQIGFGKRSWRYSMFVDDGVVKELFVEPERDGDPFEVSDADTMLRAIAPSVKVPAPVAIITRPGCPHCARAKEVLATHAMPYEEIVLGEGVRPAALQALSGRLTTPQVFVGGQHIGGADDLEQWLKKRPAAA